MEMKRPLSDSITRIPWTAKAPPMVALAKALVLESPSTRRQSELSPGRGGFLLLLLGCCHGNRAPFSHMDGVVMPADSAGSLLPPNLFQTFSGPVWQMFFLENADEIAAVPPGLFSIAEAGGVYRSARGVGGAAKATGRQPELIFRRPNRTPSKSWGSMTNTLPSSSCPVISSQ